ncbi:MAG: hypothetical protein CSA74_00655 [Rhodobacterales bacterium]|nr:MAG: hypothetical protein CSA74_00655 [Rhodobacterales bacterium]
MKPSVAKAAFVLPLLLVLAGAAGPAAAQQFTTAAEVKPMLELTRGDWVSLRERGGEDQLLFSHILAWRCGIEAISYKVNDQKRARFRAEPCYEGETRPNDIKGNGFRPYVTFPLGSVKKVRVWLDYDDGSSDSETYRRAAILLP